MLTHLDVSKLPREALYGPEGNQIDLAAIVLGMRPTIEAWMNDGAVKANDSFGFSMARLDADPAQWDDPYQTTWFAVGWGPDAEYYIANTVRKRRALRRTGAPSTLDLRLWSPELFQDPVKNRYRLDNGLYEWGDFPFGGACDVHVADLVLPGAVSSLMEVEDDAAVKAICGQIGAAMLKVRNPDLFA